MQMDQYFQANAVNINSNKTEFMVLCPKGKDAIILNHYFTEIQRWEKVASSNFYEL